MQIRTITKIPKNRMLCVLVFALATLMTRSLNGQERTMTLNQPMPTYVEAPSYPPLAYVARVTGTVVVDLTLDLSGKVQATRVVDGHPLLAGASEKTALLWRFAEAEKSGAPRQVRGWLDYKIAQGTTETEETRSAFFPPNRIEITKVTKQLPRIVSYVPADLGELAEVKCKVHRETMREDTVPIIYGLIIEEDADSKATSQQFPNASLSISGGCVVENARFARVLYCRKCRSAAADWKRRH
jgi:hypothetical protein